MGAQADELKRVLLAERVLSLPQVMHRLRCSRRTAIRRLSDVGYLSSYSHAGVEFRYGRSRGKRKRMKTSCKKQI